MRFLRVGLATCLVVSTLVAGAIGVATAATTKRVKEINPTGSSSPYAYSEVGSSVWFIANDGSHGIELWRSSWSGATTRMVKDINPSGGSLASERAVLDGLVIFVASTERGSSSTGPLTPA